ncbi:MAG: glycosyltransferase family 9 protein [Pyrinomonadaceae bacterium]
MNSLRDIVETSPHLRALAILGSDDSAQPLGPPRWDWAEVDRVLVIRLRSIGDTVLSTPSLIALKRFLPHAQVDVLLEDWVAPVLDEFASVDNIITLKRGSVSSRVRVALSLRSNRYDVVYNLHGGTTATLLTRATGAKYRIGYDTYQLARLHNQLSPSPSMLWGREKTHSVEQQLGLLGWTGVPVSDRPPTQLTITERGRRSIAARLELAGLADARLAVIHPAAAFVTKQWAANKFGQVAAALDALGLAVVAIATPNEAGLIDEVKQNSSAPVLGLTDLSLPEITALLARARLFVGNDSGIAHIATAVRAPSVVIFGSSNIAHWRPWVVIGSGSPAEVVFEEMECQPCHGYFCAQFEQPECIKRVPVERVMATVQRVLRESDPSIK